MIGMALQHIISEPSQVSTQKKWSTATDGYRIKMCKEWDVKITYQAHNYQPSITYQPNINHLSITYQLVQDFAAIHSKSSSRPGRQAILEDHGKAEGAVEIHRILGPNLGIIYICRNRMIFL